MRKVRVALFFVLTLSFLMSAVSAAPQLETANQTVAEPLQVGDRGDEVLAFSHAMLTDVAIEKMLAEIRKLRQKFAELHEESLTAPLAKRRGTGMFVAMREWEIQAFTALRRG